MLGHCFPAFYGFKGGKGVAASFGSALALNWMSALAVLIVAGVLFLISKRMSVASIGAAASYPLFIWLYAPEYLYFAIGFAIFLVIMHRANIQRLLNGEEQPLTIGKKRKAADEEDGGAAKEDETENK